MPQPRKQPHTPSTAQTTMRQGLHEPSPDPSATQGPVTLSEREWAFFEDQRIAQAHARTAGNHAIWQPGRSHGGWRAAPLAPDDLLHPERQPDTDDPPETKLWGTMGAERQRGSANATDIEPHLRARLDPNRTTAGRKPLFSMHLRSGPDLQTTLNPRPDGTRPHGCRNLSLQVWLQPSETQASKTQAGATATADWRDHPGRAAREQGADPAQPQHLTVRLEPDFFGRHGLSMNQAAVDRLQQLRDLLEEQGWQPTSRAGAGPTTQHPGIDHTHPGLNLAAASQQLAMVSQVMTHVDPSVTAEIVDNPQWHSGVSRCPVEL